MAELLKGYGIERALKCACSVTNGDESQEGEDLCVKDESEGVFHPSSTLQEFPLANMVERYDHRLVNVAPWTSF